MVLLRVSVTAGVPAAVPAGLLLAAVAVGVFAQGGYHRPAADVLVLLVAAALAGALAVPAELRRTVTVNSLPVAAALALASWCVLRGAAAGSAAAGAGWAAVALGFAATLVVLGRSDDDAVALLRTGVLALGALVALTAWAGVAWHLESWAAPHPGGIWRAHTTITYANATAGLLVPLALLAAGTAGVTAGSPGTDGRAPAPAVDVHRALPRVVPVVLLAGAGATASRGGVVALLAGAGVLALAAGVRRTSSALLPPLVGAGVALGGLLPSMTGPAPRPLVALAALAAGVVVGLVPEPRLRSLAVPGLAAAGAALAWTGGQTVSALVSARLTLASPDRWGATTAAVETWLRQPWVGVGPGVAPLSWGTAGGSVAAGRYVHNEYLQVLLQLGVVGLVLLLGLLSATCALAVRALRPRPAPLANASAAAGLAAVASASALDFLWHVPVVVVVAAVLAGLAGRPIQEGVGPWRQH